MESKSQMRQWLHPSLDESSAVVDRLVADTPVFGAAVVAVAVAVAVSVAAVVVVVAEVGVAVSVETFDAEVENWMKAWPSRALCSSLRRSTVTIAPL